MYGSSIFVVYRVKYYHVLKFRMLFLGRIIGIWAYLLIILAIVIITIDIILIIVFVILLEIYVNNFFWNIFEFVMRVILKIIKNYFAKCCLVMLEYHLIWKFITPLIGVGLKINWGRFSKHHQVVQTLWCLHFNIRASHRLIGFISRIKN